MPKAIKRKLPKRRAHKQSEPEVTSTEGVEPTDSKKTTDDEASHFLMEDVTDTDTSDDLSSIYFDEGEKKMDMTKIEKKTRKFRLIIPIVLFIVALIGIVGYLGYSIFHTGVDGTNGSVGLELTVEEKVASGDVVTIELTYVNQKPVAIESGVIELFLPDGLLVQNMTPQPEEINGYVWKIKDLKSGAAGKIRITGQLVGEKDERKEISALLTYRPSNFSQDFQVNAKKTVLITDSVISANVDVPRQIQSGQEFEYTVDFENTSKVALNDVRIILDYPKGFSYISSSLETFGSDDEWNISNLEPGEKQTLTIKGTLEGKSGESKEISFQLGLLELDNTFHAQIEKTSVIVVVNPEIDLSIDAPEQVEAGEEIQIVVKVKNTSELDMKEVDVRLSLSGALFSETEYTFKNIEKLPSLTTKELTYTTTLKKTGSTNQELEVAAKVLSANVSGNTVNFDDQATAKMQVKGTLTTTAEGRYYDDDLSKIGSGPIPPVVGETTTYLIRWNITSGVNDIKNLSLSAALPAGVTFVSSDNGVGFNNSTRKVTYSDETFNAESELELEFYVSVTPTSADVNKLLVLTEAMTATGTDSFTKETLTSTASRITTDLPNDEGAAGKGVVQSN